MKVLFLANRNSKGINFVIKKTKSFPGVNVRSIGVGQKDRHFLQNCVNSLRMLRFFYMQNILHFPTFCQMLVILLIKKSRM